MDIFEELPEQKEEKKETQYQHKVKTSFENGSLLNKRKSQNDDEKQSKKLKGTYCRLKGYFAERKGERDDMQDAHVVLDDFTEDLPDRHDTVERLAYYAVFDGHAGSRASQFCADNFHNYFKERFPKGEVSQVEKEIKKCFIDTYKRVDDNFLKEATKSKPSWKDGTTATTVIIINNLMYTANIGDSKAILCRYSTEKKEIMALSLTKDHNPTQYDERMRIQKAGGTVRDGRVMGILEVSRSIGDGPYKAHGVTCFPDVKKCTLTDKDRFIILACDGLWKSFTSQEAIKFVDKILQDDTFEATETKSVDDIKYETAANRLASEAVLRLSADNVTVVIVAIKS